MSKVAPITATGTPTPGNGTPIPGSGTPITDFNNITQVILNVTSSIFNVSTALVALMIIVAGIYLMLNRDSSMSARLEKLSFLKTILTGYAIIFAGNFLVQIVTTSLQSGGINHA